MQPLSPRFIALKSKPKDASTPAPTEIEIADQHSSSDEYAQRFSGELGKWLLSFQERGVASLLPAAAKTFLDIGGGHGQLVPVLLAHKAQITVLGSAPLCSERLQDLLSSGRIRFKVGHLVKLPFSDKSFDCAISVRIMSHCKSWQTLISEMCRVSRQTVIFDYPTWCSANVLSPILFSVKRKLEGNTRTYTTFTLSALQHEFKKHGFIRAGLEKQFFFPMGIHRALKSERLSLILEGIAKRCGLTKLFGSPVLIRFDRGTVNNE